MTAFPDRTIRRRQPSVLVHLSKVVAEDFAENPASLLRPDSTLHPRYQAKRWVSVGTLMLLQIGDIWAGQRLVAFPDYQLETFADLQIDRETAHMVKAGSSLDDSDGFLIPLAEHPWHLDNTHSYCLRVSLPEDRFLVVPCMELIRFYFGSSSELLSRLFVPSIAKEDFFKNVRFDANRGRLSFDLAERIGRASAQDVGRMALSPAAWQAAALIGGSCLRAAARSEPIYPQAAFPFEGRTNLKLSGKWLSLGNRPNGTFLTYKILSCSHPFPFRSIDAWTSGDHLQSHKSASAQAVGNRSVGGRRSARESTQTLVEHDASSQLAPKTFRSRQLRRFPDLEGKPVRVSRKGSFDDRRAPEGPAAKPVDMAAVGDPGSSDRIRPLSLEEARQRAEELKPPAFVALALQALSGMEGATISILSAGDEDGWTLPIALPADEDGVISGELFIDSPGKPSRPRRAGIIGLTTNTSQAMVLLIEDDPVACYCYQSSPNAPSGAADALFGAAKAFVGGTRHYQFAEAPCPDNQSHLSELECLRTWLICCVDATTKHNWKTELTETDVSVVKAYT